MEFGRSVTLQISNLHKKNFFYLCGTQILARRFDVTREEQDAVAAESHAKAWAAQKSGRFQEEIVPVTVKVSSHRQSNASPFTNCEFSVET